MGDVYKIWTIEITPLSIMTVSTYATMIGYFIYLVFSISVFEDDYRDLPSLSGMIAYSKGTTITFTILVFAHGYGLMAYLVIASEYIGIQSTQFKVITSCSFIYWSSLIVVSYLPLQGNENPHNVFALISFSFAVLTVLLHKHSFMVTEPGRWPYINFHVSERHLIMSELLMMVIVVVMGVLFWSFDVVIAEYIFIALILLDKYFKVYVLEKSGLLTIDHARLEYTYYSPRNQPESPAYPYQKVSTSKPVIF